MAEDTTGRRSGIGASRAEPSIPAASTALAGLRVLDLTRVRSGPTCVRQLADWGADVIKIEAPVDAAELGGPRSGPDFQNLHRNKRSMTLDLKSEAGLAAFRKLADTADEMAPRDAKEAQNHEPVGDGVCAVLNAHGH